MPITTNDLVVYRHLFSFLAYSNTVYTDLNLDILVVIWSTVLYIITNE